MKQFTFLFIIGFCVANILATCVVQTPLGLIKGSKLQSKSGRTIEAFTGVPYAEPPVGELRFKKPEPKKPWDHILEANHDRCECPQLHEGVVHGCEDCLHLNVYTPERNPKSLYPVMVFIHGNAYIAGNDSVSYLGPEFILDKDVVLVTISYRLSVLGYFSTGNDAAPGNYGIKDQVLALKWVKDHIRTFGGNPEEVTLFGQGTGSESVNLHILSKESQGLFKRAICQSGTALNPKAIAVGPSYHEKGKKVAELLKCPTKDSQKMVECLRKVNVTEIIKVSLRVFDEIDIATHNTWRPTKEPKLPGAVITDTPENLIQQKQWKKHCPLIVGNVKDEGTFFTENLLKHEKLYEHCRKEPVHVIERFLQDYSPLDGMNVTEIAIKAKDHYLGKEVPKSKEVFIEKFTNLATDFFYGFPARQLHNYIHSKPNDSSSTYAYTFGYHGSITPTIEYPGELGKTGCGQGADLYSEYPISGAFIGPQYSSLKRSKKDYDIIDIFIDLWVSFAKNSVPVSNKLKNPHLWQPLRNGTTHLKIGNGVSTEVKEEVKYSGAVDFWMENVPQYCLEG